MQKNVLLLLLSLLASQYTLAQCKVNAFQLREQVIALEPIEQKLAFMDSILLQLDECPDLTENTELAQLYYNFAFQYSEYAANEKALQLYKKAADIRQKVLVPKHFDRNKSLWKVGFSLRTLARHEESLDYYKQALTGVGKAVEAPDFLLQARIYRDLAFAYDRTGDYTKGLLYIEQSIEQFKTLQGNFDIANVLNEKATILSSLNQPNESLLVLNQALLFLSKAEHKGDLIETIYISQGNAYLAKDSLSKALAFYQKALDGSAGNLERQLDCLNNMGVIYKKQGKFDTAIERYEQTIQLIKSKEENDPSLANSFDNIGDVYFEQQEYANAIPYYQAAIQQVVPKFRGETDLYKNPNLKEAQILGSPSNLLIFLASKAEAYCRLYDKNQLKQNLVAAINSYKTADVLIDLMRYEHTEDASKLYWRKTTLPMYEQAVAAAYQVGDSVAVAFFMGKSKAILLTDAWNERNALKNKALPTAIVNEIAELKQVIRSLNEVAGNELVYLEKKEKLYRLIADLEQDYPSYYEAKYGKQAYSLGETQALLPHSSALLEFMLTDSFVYALKITKGAVICRQTKLTDDFEKTVQTYWTLLKEPRLTKEQEIGLNALSEKLHNKLLRPILAEVDTDFNRLILIPSGILQSIPFEALVNERTDKMLLEDYAVSYAFSVAVLHKNLQTKLKKSTKLLAFAPIDFPKYTKLAALRESETELQQLNALYAGKILKNKAATKQAFLAKAVDFGLLHLSTHGGIEDSSHASPWIAFADSILYLPALYFLKTQAQMAVISACETSLGTLHQGEGVMSIARGFSYAGVPSVTASLWQVSENATAEIMIAYYKQLKAGASKDIALQQAKLTYIEANSARLMPAKWAAWIHMGDVRPITRSWWVCWVLLGLGLGLLLMVLFKRHKK